MFWNDVSKVTSIYENDNSFNAQRTQWATVDCAFLSIIDHDIIWKCNSEATSRISNTIWMKFDENIFVIQKSVHAMWALEKIARKKICLRVVEEMMGWDKWILRNNKFDLQIEVINK